MPDSRRAESRPPHVAPRILQSGVPHGATENGWLADYVYTGEKFESGLAFFADTQGRITRFSREAADLAVARRLAGQVALPGLVNTHSHSWHRVARGRVQGRARSGQDPIAAWQEVLTGTANKLSPEDVFDAARLVFLEMLYAGVTCVGEFNYLHHRPDGSPWNEPNAIAAEIARAAHDVGIRIALLNIAYTRGDFRGDANGAPPQFRTPSIEQFIRDTELLRTAVEREYPADEVWLGTGVDSAAHAGVDALKSLAAYARAQRFRFHAHVATTSAENAACIAEHGRSPVALLAEHGVVDKRFTAVDALHLSDDDLKLLGAGRAMVCACPTSALDLGLWSASAERILALGAGLTFGSDSHGQIDPLKEARTLEYALRSTTTRSRRANAADPAGSLFHAASVTGARSLGATGGALEVGRPADFFTVNLFDSSMAGADAETLLAHIVFGLDRRAIRDVWIGARQRIAGGRHVNHGAIVGRFVDLQKRLWAG